MTEAQIEILLRRAPHLAVPAELLQTLQSQIALPQHQRSNGQFREWRSLLRRWMPALAVSVFFLSCIVIIGVQANLAGQVKKQNATLRAAATNLEQLRATHAADEGMRAQVAELEQLRKDNEDLRRLRAEIAQLRGLPQQIEQLQAENKRLSLSTNGSNPGEAFFDEAQKEADRIVCVNNLKQLGLATRLWSLDHKGRFPSSLVEMSNELTTVKVLICPSDKSKQAFAPVSWSEFRDEMSSYRFTAAETDETDPQSIISKCPIHNNFGLADGSVQQKSTKWGEVRKNGRRYMEPIQSQTGDQSP